MRRYKNGELIDLMSCDGAYLDEIYVRGHVDFDEATRARDAYLHENESTEPYGPWRHMYARWSMESGCDGPQMVLREYFEPGRGRFKVTMCQASWISDEREKRKLREKELRASVILRYGNDVRVLSCGTDSVSFSFPGLRDGARVTWRPSRPDEVYIATIDIEAWENWRSNADADT